MFPVCISILGSESRITLVSPKSRIPSISPDNSTHEYVRRMRVCTPAARSTPIFLNIYHDRIERGQRLCSGLCVCMHTGYLSPPENRECFENFQNAFLPRRRSLERPNFKHFLHLNASRILCNINAI